MRIITNKRRCMPSIAATLLLLAATALAPQIATGTEMSPKAHNALSDGAVITAPGNSSAAVAANKVEVSDKNQPTYHQSISAALNHQGLTEKHLTSWQEEHPLSTLNKLGEFDHAKQKKVANVAAFIKKVNPDISAKTAWREACALVYYSDKYKVPYDLAVGIAKTESRFNPSAQSKSGALGVMQVVWKVHNKMLRARGIAPTRDHMFDPERGIEAGVLILSRYISAYGTVQKALNRYYGGVARSYLKKVNNNVAMLQRHSNSSGY